MKIRDKSIKQTVDVRCQDWWIGQCATWELLEQMGEILNKYEARK